MCSLQDGADELQKGVIDILKLLISALASIATAGLLWSRYRNRKGASDTRNQSNVHARKGVDGVEFTVKPADSPLPHHPFSSDKPVID